MIVRLEAEDFVRFHRLEADLSAGLTVVSGDSGAGKTVFLQALRFVLGAEAGGRALAEQRIRAGADAATVQARLQLGARLQAAASEIVGVACGPTLTLRRTIRRGGRGSCWVDDRKVSRSLLATLGRRLTAFLGQGEATLLRDEEQQRAILDAHAGITEQVEAYAARRSAALLLAAELADVEEKLAAATSLTPEHAAELAVLRDLGPELHEYEELGQRSTLLQERLDQVLEIARIRARLEALDLHGGCLEIERELHDHDAHRLTAASEALAAAGALLGEALASVEAEAHDREAEAAEAQAERAGVVARLEAFRAAARRLRTRPEALADRWAALCARSPDPLESERARLATRLTSERRALDAAADTMSKARGRSARRLRRELPQGLSELGLSGATVAIDLSPIEATDGALLADHPAPWGRERIGIRVGPNGDAPGSLALLSGGELARVFLVLGRYASADRTLICDEIDQNVGARLGAAVGTALASLATERQVVAVTHLAPVAARADLHLKVEKRRGRSRISPLSRRAERLQELALMINGEATRAALAQARELLRGRVVNAA